MRISALFGLVCVLSTTGCIEIWKGIDADGDGWSVADGDCVDADFPDDDLPEGISAKDIYPGATEIWYDGIDMDCLFDDDFDPDKDRYVIKPEYFNQRTIGVAGSPGHLADGDCDDLDAFAYPGAPDTWYDGVDSDCAGNDDYDQDYDGYTSIDEDPTGGLDCDDTDGAINPDAVETCNDIDDDCNGDIDDGMADSTTWYKDADADGYGDSEDTIMGCEEYSDYVLVDGDCDDTDANINPDESEVCDDVDNDCDGDVDEEDAVDATEWYADGDSDGYGDPDSSLVGCDAPPGHVAADTDCDDTRSDVYPGATEVCDDFDTDEDCNGYADNDDEDADLATMKTFHPDADLDGYGDSSVTELACDQPAGHVVNNLDCDDTNAAINPDAHEVCDDRGIDENCDTVTDDERTWYADTDSDGYGDASVTQDSCSTPAGYVAFDTDCDDTDADVNPGATEVCDPDDVDEDCDTLVDDADPSVDTSTHDTFYADSDGDSYGDPSSTTAACELPASGYVIDDTDCDDTNALVNPGAVEVCDSSDTDEDCDGYSDDDDTSVDITTMDTFFSDTDADGYGDPSSDLNACDQPSSYVANDADCDDTDGAINPGATEVCDTANVDEDCDGDADDADLSVDTATYSTFFADSDVDGYGDAASSTGACDQPTGYVVNDADCDDTDGAINPGATEVCDTFDNDCDGDIDDDDTSVDATSFLTWYLDADSDTYGDAGTPGYACAAPTGYVSDDTDCDDADSAINPGATEVCDAADVDENCNSSADDADATTDPSSHLVFYADADLDGYGDVTSTTSACEEPSGFVSDSTDCDDTQVDVNPAATEVCDEFDVDEDCDGLSDDDDSSVDTSTQFTWYADSDGDGSGDATSTTTACDEPSGFVANDYDCDDTDSAVVGSDWYADADGDGYGDASVGQTACAQPTGYVADDTDCDDTDASISPAGHEAYYDLATDTITDNCSDGVDNNCSGTADEAEACVDDIDADGLIDGYQTVFPCDIDSDGDDDGWCMADAYTHQELGSTGTYPWVSSSTITSFTHPWSSISLADANPKVSVSVSWGGNTWDSDVALVEHTGGISQVRCFSDIGSDGSSTVDTSNTADWVDCGLQRYCATNGGDTSWCANTVISGSTVYFLEGIYSSSTGELTP